MAVQFILEGQHVNHLRLQLFMSCGERVSLRPRWLTVTFPSFFPNQAPTKGPPFGYTTLQRRALPADCPSQNEAVGLVETYHPSQCGNIPRGNTSTTFAISCLRVAEKERVSLSPAVSLHSTPLRPPSRVLISFPYIVRFPLVNRYWLLVA